MRRATSPDGRAWELRASRFRLPRWRQNTYDPWRDQPDIAWGIFATVILLPTFVVVVPALAFLAELPIAVARGLIDRGRWVEAVCWHPRESRITWRIDNRHDLPKALKNITENLSRGDEPANVDGAVIVSNTRFDSA